MSKKEKNTSHKKETKSANNKHEQEVIEQEVETTTEEQPSKAADNTEDILTEKDKEIAELKDKYMRLMADFDNFRKRVVKEKMQLMDTAAEDTMTALLPVLDDFDRAKAAAACKDGKEPFSEGVSLVYNKLFSTLKQKGLEKMECLGENFDPELHEAISEIPAPSEDMKGKIVDTVEKGYKLKDKIIRHAKVVVGK